MGLRQSKVVKGWWWNTTKTHTRYQDHNLLSSIKLRERDELEALLIIDEEELQKCKRDESGEKKRESMRDENNDRKRENLGNNFYMDKWWLNTYPDV